MNTVVGFQAADSLASGTSNTVVGGRAFYAADGSETNSTIIGTDAGNAINHDDTDGNVIIGNDAGTGGAAALIDCVAIGYNAMNSTGGNAQTGTVAIGKNALTACTSGSSNTAVGFNALASEDTGDRNTAVGYNSLTNVNGATDNSNSGFGYNSGDVITTGTNNTCIGANTDPSANSGANQTVIGSGATGQADNSVTLGNDDVTDIFMGSDKGAAVRADNNKIVCQGVEFPDTQSASGDANILDDYEEGTWTPASAGSGGYSATSFSGNYVKIGKMVYVSGQFTVDGAGTLDSISNFPFTNASILATGTAVESTNQGDFQLVQLDGGATAGRMRQENNESGYVVNDLIRFNVTYMTA